MMEMRKIIQRWTYESYLCSFLDNGSSKRCIYGGVAFLPLLVKLVDLCCNSRQPHRSPLYLVHSGVSIVIMLVRRADNDQLGRILQGGTPLAKLMPEVRYRAVSRAI